MNQTNQLIKFLIIALVATAFLGFVSKSEAQTQGPFGGDIILMRPCIGGYLITLGPPSPGEYFSGPGTRSFMFGAPSHVGQWLLGLSGGSVSCYLGPVYYGQGPFILFHGSSI